MASETIQLDETDWSSDDDQPLESLRSLLAAKSVDLCILWRNSIIATRKVKRWNFPYLPQDRQNPQDSGEALAFLAESARELKNRLAARR